MSVLRYAIWLLFAAAAAIVCFFELRPSPGGEFFNVWDKLQHFGAYAMLSLLAGLAARSWREALVWALLLAAAGYALEILQSYVGRDYDLGDEAANALGCLAGFACSRMIVTVRARL